MSAFHRFNVSVGIFLFFALLLASLTAFGGMTIDYFACEIAMSLLVHWLLLAAYLLWRSVLFVRRIPVAGYRGDSMMFAPTIYAVCMFVVFNLTH